MSVNVYFFVPNLIGYVRIVLLLVSIFYMAHNYMIASVCYIVSTLLDAVDGCAARKFNQCTKFGAMLDQLTDRCSTMCICAVLAHFYPNYMIVFLLSMTIDIACHWMYLHASVLQGKTSHKFIDLSENWLMHLYYTDRNVLFFMCAGNEFFYATLYLLHFTYGPWSLFGVSLLKLSLLITAPVALIKTGISLLHFVVASRNLVGIDVAERSQSVKQQ